MKNLAKQVISSALRRQNVKLIPEQALLKERLMLGKLLSEQQRLLPTPKSIHELEFSVFSQWGDDGIIQYLIRKLDIPQKTFIEFGVENYQEANTRFLLHNDNWRGLIFDGSQMNIDFIRAQNYFAYYGLEAKQLFVTRENINEEIRQSGFSGEIGILHIDIDGNDYWVWEAIEAVNPIIAIMEINAYFGNEKAISISYQADFFRTSAHHSNLYFGASLKAFCHLAEQKGYVFIGCTSSGNNAYFVRKDKVDPVSDLITTAEAGYVRSNSREHRDDAGNLTFRDGYEARMELNGLPVINVETREEELLNFLPSDMVK